MLITHFKQYVIGQQRTGKVVDWKNFTFKTSTMSVMSECFKRKRGNTRLNLPLFQLFGMFIYFLFHYIYFCSNWRHLLNTQNPLSNMLEAIIPLFFLNRIKAIRSNGSMVFHLALLLNTGYSCQKSLSSEEEMTMISRLLKSHTAVRWKAILEKTTRYSKRAKSV